MIAAISNDSNGSSCAQDCAAQGTQSLQEFNVVAKVGDDIIKMRLTELE